MSMFIMKPYYAKNTEPAHVTTTFATTSYKGAVPNRSQATYFLSNYASVATTYSSVVSTVISYNLIQPLIKFNDISYLYNIWSQNRTTFRFTSAPFSTKSYTSKSPGQTITESGTGVSNSIQFINTQEYGNIIFTVPKASSSRSSSSSLVFYPNYRESYNNILATVNNMRATYYWYIGYCELTDPYKITLVSLPNYTDFNQTGRGTMFRATLTELPV